MTMEGLAGVVVYSANDFVLENSTEPIVLHSQELDPAPSPGFLEIPLAKKEAFWGRLASSLLRIRHIIS